MADLVVVIASTLQSPNNQVNKLGDFMMEVIFRPIIPDNQEHFEDDKKIVGFLQNGTPNQNKSLE